jgi:hypothetical protein
VGFPVSWSDLRLQLHPSAVLRLPDFMASDRAQQIDSDRRRSSFSRRAAVHFQIGRPFCADQPLAHSRRLDPLLHRGQQSKWRIMAGAALCFLAASVHPYIVVMVLLIDAATHLRVATSGKETANTALSARLRLMGLRIGISLTSAIAALIIFGYLRPLELQAYADGGYGAFSMNLLAPIDPARFGALVLKPQPQASTFQYEGYNYLGLGVIL